MGFGKNKIPQNENSGTYLGPVLFGVFVARLQLLMAVIAAVVLVSLITVQLVAFDRFTWALVRQEMMIMMMAVLHHRYNTFELRGTVGGRRRGGLCCR